MIDDDFALTASDKISSVWLKLEAHYKARLAGLRAQNDCDMPDALTQRQRGRIAEAKYFLELGEDNPIIE